MRVAKQVRVAVRAAVVEHVPPGRDTDALRHGREPHDGRRRRQRS
jgi:hypothetical protein